MTVKYEKEVMEYIKNIFFIIFLFMICYQSANGQVYTGKHPININIPEITIVDFEPNNLPIKFEFEASNEAGGIIHLNAAQQKKWLNYTCALGNNATPRNIYMQVANGDIPEGISLGLNIGNPIGGKGQLGTAVGAVQLTEQPQLIITGIGGSFTGNGENAGYPMTYDIGISDYKKLKAASDTNIKIMITITN